MHEFGVELSPFSPRLQQLCRQSASSFRRFACCLLAVMHVPPVLLGNHNHSIKAMHLHLILFLCDPLLIVPDPSGACIHYCSYCAVVKAFITALTVVFLPVRIKYAPRILIDNKYTAQGVVLGPAVAEV